LFLMICVGPCSGRRTNIPVWSGCYHGSPHCIWGRPTKLIKTDIITFPPVILSFTRAHLMKPSELQSLYNEILTEGNDRFSTTMGIVSHIENDEY